MGYVKTDLFKIPPDNTKIWRFIDFSKFYSILSTHSLHFSRLDNLEDKFEGHYSKTTLQFLQKVVDLPDNDDHVKNVVRMLTDPIRKKLFVNCWHIDDYESELLWNRYASTNTGVAIQSIVKRLKDSIQREVYIAQVEYFDWEQMMPYDNPLKRVAFKMKGFSDEHELRAIIPYESNQRLRGKTAKVNLQDLIENVYVSPRSQTWFRNMLKSILRDFGIKIPVNKSIFSERPFVPRFMRKL